MKLTKSSPALVATFEAVFPEGGERKQMFGYPSGFVNGHMFAGLFAESFFVRVGESDRKTLLALPGARVFEPMAGRPMKDYVCVPAALHEDRAALQRWIDKALAHTASLPPKVKARPAAKKPVAKKR
jgi:TfoX/Sxy family transcriptional regulator of competence genes